MGNTVFSLIALLMLSSCASIFNRTTKDIAVTSSPSGLYFEVRDRQNKLVSSGTTPASIQLSSRYGFFKGQTYTFTAKRAGTEVGSMVMYAGLSPWYFGNLVLGGALGMLIIDPATGGMWTLPKAVHIEAKPGWAVLKPTENRLQVLALSDLPPHLRKHLVRI